jgi:hypothetical protein
MTDGSYCYGAMVKKTKTFTCPCIPPGGKDLALW